MNGALLHRAVGGVGDPRGALDHLVAAGKISSRECEAGLMYAHSRIHYLDPTYSALVELLEIELRRVEIDAIALLRLVACDHKEPLTVDGLARLRVILSRCAMVLEQLEAGLSERAAGSPPASLPCARGAAGR